MQLLLDLLVLYWEYLKEFLSFFWTPDDRLFLLYLFTALVFAFLVYKFHRYKVSSISDAVDGEKSTFFKFLFPAQVWSHPSAWLDVRYFFFHNMIGHFLLFGVLIGCSTWAFAFVTGGKNLAELARIGDTQVQNLDYAVAVIYMLAFYLVLDFIAYFLHYLQHKIPVLWEFHKVHHSAEVMHPMSNFREHPIDNLVYKVFIGAGHGAVMGIAVETIGYVPSMPAVFGVPLLMFLFNFMGYNLRHSHVWLRWPGMWSKVFPSPAHHHVHHSCHPDHIDKNFAFMFPMWDVIFGTYELPENNKDVKFGVKGMSQKEMDSCLKLYIVPFSHAFRRLRKQTKKNAYSVKSEG